MSKEILNMPCAGHFIGAGQCKFFKNTYVNGFIVSTVGEYRPSGKTVEIGFERFYETMVFKAKKSDVSCCKYVQSSGRNIDFAGYKTELDAEFGHYRMVFKYEKKRSKKKEASND